MFSRRKKTKIEHELAKDMSIRFENPTTITLYNAVGGKIVKFAREDNNTGRYYETVYIINDNSDFKEELTNCITMEALKHGK